MSFLRDVPLIKHNTRSPHAAPCRACRSVYLRSSCSLSNPSSLANNRWRGLCLYLTTSDLRAPACRLQLIVTRVTLATPRPSIHIMYRDLLKGIPHKQNMDYLFFLGKRAWLTVTSGDIGSQSPRATARGRVTLCRR